MKQLQADYPVQRLCQVLEVARSSAYYQPVETDERELVRALEQLLMRWPFYGYRRLQAQLRREGFAVGERRVRRLLKALGGSRQVGHLAVQTTDSRHAHWRYPNLLKRTVVNYPDQVWCADITYIRLAAAPRARFLYLAVILDLYTRAVRGWALGRRVDGQLTLDALDKALAEGRPAIFHSDQGVQYAAWAHTERLREAGCQISMSERGQPTQNAFAERFIRTFKEEHLDYADYTDFDDAEDQIRQWLEETYMTQRIHSALGYLTPAEFEANAIAIPPLSDAVKLSN